MHSRRSFKKRVHAVKQFNPDMALEHGPRLGNPERNYTPANIHFRQRAENMVMQADAYMSNPSFNTDRVPVESGGDSLFNSYSDATHLGVAVDVAHLERMSDEIELMYGHLDIYEDDPRLRMQSFAPTTQLDPYPHIVEGPNPRSALDEEKARVKDKIDTWTAKRDFLFFDPRAETPYTMDGQELTEYTHSVHALIERAHDHGLETQSLEQLIEF